MSNLKRSLRKEKSIHLKNIDNNKYRQIVEELCTQEKELRVHNMLKHEFFPMFSEVRSEMVLQIIQERFKKVREA